MNIVDGMKHERKEWNESFKMLMTALLGEERFKMWNKWVGLNNTEGKKKGGGGVPTFVNRPAKS